MQIESVAFDMDGLMFNTEDVYWKCASVVLGQRGHEYTQELCDQIMGRPPKFCFEKMIEYYGLDETWTDLRNESENVFIGLLDDGFDMMPGLLNLLEHLETANIPKCVCTSSSRRVANEVLGRSNMLNRFDFVLASDDVVNGKPNPEIYEKAAGRFAISPENMLVLEDSASGCLAAKDSGAFVVAVLAEHNRNFDFSNASLIVSQLDDEKVLAFFQ